MTVIDWLINSDPSIRWQVMRDHMDQPEADVARERSRVALEGWGARLLDLQAPDGYWGGAAFVPRAWIDTKDTLQLLRDLGADPASERVRAAIGKVRDHCNWGPGFANSPFFAGETEACINGRVLAAGVYFGAYSPVGFAAGAGAEASSSQRDRLVKQFLDEQLEDGGWNCYAPPSKRSSFNSTICVLEGLLEYERSVGDAPQVKAARLRGQEYLLERRLFRSLRTGEIINPAWTQISFPTRWHYDILWGLDYLRRTGATPDRRIAEAVDLVAKKKARDGRWPLENPHVGPTHFEMEGGEGEPSRWNTLRAMRVLRWAGAG